MLRALAGADEGILDQVPLERTRYVGLGGVVLGTAVVAGISMWFALSQVLGGAHVAMLVPTVIWMLIVLNFDRWLVSTVTGVWHRRILILVPRLLVSVVLGFIIAEPLVLRVFETAIVQHVVDGRQAALNTERDRLLECNPRVPTGAPARRDCGDARLLASTTEADVAELRDLESDAGRLRTRVEADRRRHGEMVDKATGECAGDNEQGMSGKKGIGPLCRRLDSAAKNFLVQSHLSDNERKLRSLESRITAMRGPLAGRQADFAKKIEAGIEERLSALPGPADPVGLLERMRALQEVTAVNSYLSGASWLFRLFLILVDCLPVLVKLMGGTTAYDRMADHANRRDEEIHSRRLQLHTEARIGELELHAHRDAADRRRQWRQVTIAGRAVQERATESPRTPWTRIDFAESRREIPGGASGTPSGRR
ncbi:DUF4407 domain-containing protein [Streptosporangium sp. NBC_01639]|uniref:DUF4407 domain-containing protein n=1 Tax=Streptosporangium sp. NBC_01639 TaxID=2975948 RepID=UPI003869C9AE|nr:DUF4407 domain-containing protein [Streptosporangium sp. NBC_01639]